LEIFEIEVDFYGDTLDFIFNAGVDIAGEDT
jgi:hypothetical protein